MASLGNNARGVPGHRNGAYFFEDNDSDDQSTSDLNPLIRRPSSQDTPSPYTHIITGYLSIVELIALVTYLGSLIGLTLWKKDYGNTTHYSYIESESNPDKMVAFFSMVHVGVWILVGIFDRIIQWRHQALRRKGYLKFYRQMRNVRRVPFVIVSLCNASLLLFVSILYFYSVQQSSNFHKLHPVVMLYVIIGIEMVLTLPCLIYYIVRATVFNYLRQPPDVIQETMNGPSAPVSTVGFRDGEDLDELLERQADMIRYLQQHNANLGRRILELQSQTMD